jgi:hypothetical protein
LRVIAAVSIAKYGRDRIAAPNQHSGDPQQHDQPGSPAARKLDTIIRHIEQQGVDVLLMPPPAWVAVKDINDATRGSSS